MAHLPSISPDRLLEVFEPQVHMAVYVQDHQCGAAVEAQVSRAEYRIEMVAQLQALLLTMVLMFRLS
jgi:hypothetical protein